MRDSLAAKAFTAFISRDLRAAGASAGQALELALRIGDPVRLAYRFMIQLFVDHFSGDFVGTEKQFTSVSAFFNEPAFRNDPVGGFIAVFGAAPWNASVLGRADLARERADTMRAAINPTNPHDIVWSNHYLAVLYLERREYERVEKLAPPVLELCEKYHFPNEAASA
jgi:hypothetical protein